MGRAARVLAYVVGALLLLGGGSTTATYLAAYSASGDSLLLSMSAGSGLVLALGAYLIYWGWRKGRAEALKVKTK